MEPFEGRIKRVTNFAMVLLPLPDSPTRPMISPLNTSKETPLTAFVIFLLKSPGYSNTFLRFLTLRMGFSERLKESGLLKRPFSRCPEADGIELINFFV